MKQMQNILDIFYYFILIKLYAGILNRFVPYIRINIGIDFIPSFAEYCSFG